MFLFPLPQESLSGESVCFLKYYENQAECVAM